MPAIRQILTALDYAIKTLETKQDNDVMYCRYILLDEFDPHLFYIFNLINPTVPRCLVG